MPSSLRSALLAAALVVVPTGSAQAAPCAGADAPGATPRDVLRAWLDSPGHRATLLSARYRDTGVARRVASLRGAGRVELWVQHFGRRC